MGEGIRLVHYMAEAGEGEYLIVIDKDESPMDYKEPGYSVSGVFHLEVATGDINSLPIGITLDI